VNLPSVCIPSSVEILGPKSFSLCYGLSDLTFEAGSKLSRIEDFAFYRCRNLESLRIPSEVVYIGTGAIPRQSSDSDGVDIFRKFTGVSIDAQSRQFTTLANFIVDLAGVSVAYYFGSEVEVAVPASVETLGSASFADCLAISVVRFENASKLKEIGRHAFCRCSNLISFCIPASVEVLCGDCFSDCKRLSVLTFESSSRLSQIGDSAFCRCSRLTTICIPSSVETIGEHCFYGCRRLSVLTFDADSKLARIGNHAFSRCERLITICIPASVEIIREFSFGGCAKLAVVTFENGSKLKRIEQFAFSGCSALRAIVTPGPTDLLCPGHFAGLYETEFGIQKRFTLAEQWQWEFFGRDRVDWECEGEREEKCPWGYDWDGEWDGEGHDNGDFGYGRDFDYSQGSSSDSGSEWESNERMKKPMNRKSRNRREAARKSKTHQGKRV
jgi:hypothetical protein